MASPFSSPLSPDLQAAKATTQQGQAVLLMFMGDTVFIRQKRSTSLASITVLGVVCHLLLHPLDKTHEVIHTTQHAHNCRWHLIFSFVRLLWHIVHDNYIRFTYNRLMSLACSLRESDLFFSGHIHSHFPGLNMFHVNIKAVIT